MVLTGYPGLLPSCVVRLVGVLCGREALRDLGAMLLIVERTVSAIAAEGQSLCAPCSLGMQYSSADVSEVIYGSVESYCQAGQSPIGD